MVKTKIRSVYQDRPMVAVVMQAGEPGKLRTGKVQQHFKNEVDINQIMARYTQTGVLQAPGMRSERAVFGDFSGLDFQDSLHRLDAAKASFAALPSRMRARFNNDPAELLKFVGDRKNEVEARSMGLIKPLPQSVVEKPTAQPQPVVEKPDSKKA